MIFSGIRKVFSTENAQQYETIGRFWDELSAIYGIENLQGLGYGWTESTIDYVIGLKKGTIPGADCIVELPDSGWGTVCGRLADLDRIYDEIYRSGRLKYEIEMFSETGNCKILYCR